MDKKENYPLANAEQAIRNALLKIDSSNVAQRRRVYESA